MAERITIDVTETGETTVKVEGCPGPSCKSLTAAIESAIGSTAKDIKTGEFHQTSRQSQGQEQRA